MKQAVIAVGWALMSCSLMTHATTTTPKEKRSGDEIISAYSVDTDNGKNLDESRTKITVAPIESTRIGASLQSTTAATDDVKVLKYRTDAVFQSQTGGEVDYSVHTKKGEEVGTIPTTTMANPLPNCLDFRSLEGQSTPLDVPVLSDVLQLAAHVSSGTNGSAQIVTGWNGLAADHWFGGAADAPFVAAAGPLAIDFPNRASTVSLTYWVDGQWQKLDADTRFALSIVLLDAEGNLVDSRNIVLAPSEIANAQLVELASSRPFQRLILTPSDDDIWFLSDVMISFNRYKPALADDYAHTSIGQTFTDDGPALTASDRCIPTFADDRRCN